MTSLPLLLRARPELLGQRPMHYASLQKQYQLPQPSEDLRKQAIYRTRPANFALQAQILRHKQHRTAV